MDGAHRKLPRLTRVLLGLVPLLAMAPPARAQAGSPPPASPQRFGQVPPFSFTERSGRRVTLDDLLGEPWIAVPFFVACTGPCPSLTADLRLRLHDALEEAGVRIVSFSLDPDLDTPEQLREHAGRYHIDSPRWLMVTGEEQELHRFVREGLKVAVARAPANEAVEYGQSITHSTRLPVVDPQGRIAGWYECGRGALGDDPQRIEEQFALLLARARAVGQGAVRRPSRLPLVNALLNGTAGLLLVAGLLAIRSGRRALHGWLMRSAFLVSATFLACYLYYHLVVQRQTGPTHYNGQGWRKGAYLALLGSHVLLAIVNLPMVLRTLWLAQRQDWERHKRMARRTFPIWLYVSITGVLVYLILYHGNPPPTLGSP